MAVDLLLPRGGAQESFLRADEEYVALISGYGLGKTFILCVKAILLAQENAGCTGLLVAHTYQQMRDNLIPKYRGILEDWGIPYSWAKSEHRLTLPWGDVLFRTAEKPIVGFDAGYAAVDEACLCKDDVFKDILARVRDPRAKKTQKIFTSTPEGRRGWIYKNFAEKPLPGSLLIQGSTIENKRHLGKGYVDALEAAYDDRLQQGYLHGAFVDFNSQPAYHAFNEGKTVTDTWPHQTIYGSYELMKPEKNVELSVSFDFGNVVSCLRIARNTAVTRARRRERLRPSLRAHDEDADSAPGMPRVVARSGATEPPPSSVTFLRATYEEFSSEVRETVRLRYEEGLSCKEIAHCQDVTLSCIKTRLHRARQRLRAAVLET